MESKKINQLATEMAPATSDLTIIGDPITGVSKKITLLQIADLFATTGTVSSVAVTETGDALTITGSPITSAGTINIGFAGDATQYVRGDGALADFPTSTGGGSSVSYYLNSSVSQGTIGGVAYREFSKDPIAGAGTDITASTNGYIASYITDANDPALLEVPAGNFNCEFYFSVNSNAHNPYVYAEVYKYDGTTFTLIGSSQSVPEYLTNGTTLSPYYFAIPVTQTTLAITDRIAIRIYVNVDTRVVTLHTENNHLCQVVTTFSKGLTSLNNLTRQVQFLATGTSGTDFAISSSTATHTFNLPVASATNTGKLSSTDWSTFNAKQPAIGYTPANDSLVVHLAGNETITGTKFFQVMQYFNTYPIYSQVGIALDYRIGASAVSFCTTVGANVNGLQINLEGGGYNSLNFASTSVGNTYTFPNATGTIALTSNLSSYVPYTGATANVTLGLFDLYAQNVFATDTSGNWLAALSRDTATAIGTLVLKSGGFTNYLQPITTVSSARTWTLPDASGTIALTSNLHNPVTIGTANGLSLSTQVLSLALASTSANGALSSTDWNTFNGKQNALTNPITGTGTRSIYYIPVFSGSDTTIENSIIQQVSSNIGIGVSPSYKLDVNGTGRFSDALNGTSAVFSSTVQASAYRLTGMTAGNGALYWSSDRVTLANYNATGLVIIEANGGTVTSTFGGATYNNDFVGTGRFTGALTGTSATFSGSVGIGVSPFANSLSVGLDMAGGAGLFGFNNRFILTGNAYYNVDWKYKATGAAAVIQSNTDGSIDFLNAASGTINNSISFSPRMVITSGGNVGIGTTSTGFNVAGLPLVVGSGSGNTGMTIFSGSASSGSIHFADAETTGSASFSGFINYDHAANSMQFGTSNTNQMRITSGGNVLVGTTGAFDTGVTLTNGGRVGATTLGDTTIQCWNKAASGNNLFLEFYTDGGGGAFRGSIDYLRSAGLVRYNTTSDANLKNIIGDADKKKSIDILKSTKIREYYWKDDKSNKPQIGVIAQELYETYKGAVSKGSDDELFGTEEYKTWGVDKTAFTFHLIAGWQKHEQIINDLQAQIEELKAKIK